MEVIARKGVEGQAVRVTLKPKSHIHFIGIAGTAMAGIAGVLNSLGYSITGSDENFYPPMSDQLKKTKIPLLEGFDKTRIKSTISIVVIGNSISSNNEEAEATLKQNIPYVSLPEMVHASLVCDKQCLLVAGTHGKTTTSSLLAWVVNSAFKDVSFLIGGIPNNFESSFTRTESSRWFVVEGDEYDSAFFDKRPKFIHYKPFSAIITSIEFDHADIYESIDTIKKSFELLARSLPKEGLLIANAEDPDVLDVIRQASCKKVVTYGVTKGDYQIQNRTPINKEDYQQFYVQSLKGDSTLVQLSSYGLHNAMNALSVYALATELNFKKEDILKALLTFKGVKRRCQILTEQKQAVLIEDFAHHPTAAKSTLDAISERFPERKVIVVFEPRSASSRRNVFQKQYVESFSKASSVYVAPPYRESEIKEEERFSSAHLVQELKEVKGVDAHLIEDVKQTAKNLVQNIQEPSVIVVMSNGPFDGIHQLLKQELEQQSK